jgi:hypothetical protein
MHGNNFPFDDKKKQAKKPGDDPRWQHHQNVAMRGAALPDANVVQQSAHSSSSLGDPEFRYVLDSAWTSSWTSRPITAHILLLLLVGRHVAMAPSQAQPFGFASSALQIPGFPGPTSGGNPPGWPSTNSSINFSSSGGAYAPMPGMPAPSMSMQQPMGFAQQQWGATVPNINVNAPKAPVSTAYGWILGKLIFEPRDPYFPREMIKLEINQEDVDEAMMRIQSCFQRLSIQVDFEHNPAGAKLRTLEHIELYMVFFEDNDGVVAVDIQRRQGDYLDANRYIHQILDAARGVTAEELVVAAPSASRIREFENFLDRCASVDCSTTTPADAGKDAGKSPWATPPTPEESMKSTLENIRRSLTSPRMDQRRSGLENLNTFTDLEKTLSQMAMASALVVVAGIPPLPAYQQQCLEIQKVIIKIIMKQKFDGDDTNMFSDMDEDIVGFLSSDSVMKEGRSRYYDHYMSEMFHLALTVLSNSLEVLQVFNDGSASYNMGTAVSDLNAACMTCVDFFDTGIVETLMEVVGQAKQRLPDAYLACKALSLLLAANSDLCSVFRGNPNYKKIVTMAVEAGSHHLKLQSEAKKLHACF